jgi:putative SOS response-associated peptidase YedK
MVARSTRLLSTRTLIDTIAFPRASHSRHRSHSIATAGGAFLDLLRWGLVPWWAKDIKIGARCINAMAETVATKPVFRDAFARGQRCIVPVDAFYEWKKTSAGKQPYAIVGANGLPLAMAGLWERWKERGTG